MSNVPFTFPPPPPPPPRRDTQTAPAFPQSNYPYAQPGRGRGRGSGFGVRGDSAGQYGRGRADYRGNTPRGAYGRGGNGNAVAYGGYQQQNSYAAPYGQANNDASSRKQHYTRGRNQASQGGTVLPHSYHHNGPNGSHLQNSYGPPSRDRPPQGSHTSPLSSGGVQSLRKRPYSTAFTKPTTTGPRPQAAPAVPSFNASIPLSVPAKSVEPPPDKTKKPRTHNQLGLTPASQDHESNSDDDENEEAKLASSTLNNVNVVQIEYNGRTATLRTAADIAAWIAERKKRFPTQAKAEAAKKEGAEKKRKWEEAKKQREEATRAKRLERERMQQEALRLKALESKKHKAEHKELEKATRTANEELEDDEEREIRAKKARIKAEKLRLKAEKAELKLLEVEVAARKAREQRASLQSGASVQDEAGAKEGLAQDADSAIALEDDNEGAANVTSNAPDLSTLITAPTKGADDDKDKTQISDSSSELLSSSPLLSEISDADESTSSSGSSSSTSTSDSDSDSAPEQTTSKRLHPTPVPPPPRHQPPNNLCRRLLATGHCHFGAGCHYSHDLPDTLPSLDDRRDRLKLKRRVRLGKAEKKAAAAAAAAPVKERRKGLWQVMVEKEKAEERERVLRAIVYMGENGMLGEDGGGGDEDRADGAAEGVVGT